MRNVKKLSAAVAMAIGTAGAGLVQADAIMFPYVVSSPTVTTVLSVVNADEFKLHWRYWYKAGANATNNDATCEESSYRWTSSPNDLVDVSVDGYFGDAMGAMFNDPSKNADYSDTTDRTMSLLKGIDTPIRAFAIVDNDENASGPRDVTVGQATVIEFVNGAAWGYRGYDALSPLAQADYDFSESQERFGEVFGPRDNDPADSGANISFKPFAEFQTNLYVTPIVDDYCTGQETPSNGNCPNHQDDENQQTGNAQARVALQIPDYFGGLPNDVAVDRDENLIDGRTPKNITCVGAVSVQDLMSQGAELSLEDQGGWGRVVISRPELEPTLGNIAKKRVDEATVMFLEYNLGGTIDGTPVAGVVNNGFMLNER